MPQRNSTLKSPVAAQTVLEGGCLCGAIRYKVTGPALDRGSCHCKSCRKASSAPELPYAQFTLSHFEITRGWPAQYRSSAEATRTDSAGAVFHTGDDVIHATLGEGVVIGTEPGGIVVVRFAGDGKERKLMADYAPIRKR